MPHNRTYPEIGARLHAIRTAFTDASQVEWAKMHGFSPTQYNNWETGTRRISIDSAMRLCRTYGLTLDYIYLGRVDGLSENAAKSLSQQ